jgi:hypothetical protein
MIIILEFLFLRTMTQAENLDVPSFKTRKAYVSFTVELSITLAVKRECYRHFQTEEFRTTAYKGNEKMGNDRTKENITCNLHT